MVASVAPCCFAGEISWFGSGGCWARKAIALCATSLPTTTFAGLGSPFYLPLLPHVPHAMGAEQKPAIAVPAEGDDVEVMQLPVTTAGGGWAGWWLKNGRG